jgi:hypothetical protein
MFIEAEKKTGPFGGSLAEMTLESQMGKMG